MAASKLTTNKGGGVLNEVAVLIFYRPVEKNEMTFLQYTQVFQNRQGL
jgi:hypothetical protein